MKKETPFKKRKEHFVFALAVVISNTGLLLLPLLHTWLFPLTFAQLISEAEVIVKALTECLENHDMNRKEVQERPTTSVVVSNKT